LKKRKDINAKFIENQELKDDIKNEIKEFLKKIEGMNVITF
jgi:formiminotetrahydrofolate cyclodeaminase